MHDIKMHVSLFPSVTVRDHLARREQFINIICNDKYLDNFWTTLLVSIGRQIEHNLRNARKLHLLSELTCQRHFITLLPDQQKAEA